MFTHNRKKASYHAEFAGSTKADRSVTVPIGMAHHVPCIDPVRVEDARIGSVIEIGPPDTAQRPSHRAIAAIAEDGIYRPSRHLEQSKCEGRVPGGDYEGSVDAHVRRVEALRRAGIAERIDAEQWRIPQNFESRAAAYDARRNRQASVRVLSTSILKSRSARTARRGSTGGSYRASRRTCRRAASASRSARRLTVASNHIARGDAARQPDGRVFYRRNLLGVLREREVARAGTEMAASKNLPFRAASDGATVSGKFTGTVQQ